MKYALLPSWWVPYHRFLMDVVAVQQHAPCLPVPAPRFSFLTGIKQQTQMCSSILRQVCLPRWHPCRGGRPHHRRVMGLLRQCHAPICRSNETSALLMSFQITISFKDAENLLIVLIHLYLLHLIKLEWRSRISSGVRWQGPGGEGRPLLLSGGRVGR